jgi:hypothetical protein
MAEVRRADSISSGAWACEELASEARCLKRCSYVLENVAFGDDLATSTNFEGMSGIIVPVVVDGVKKGVSADLGCTTRGLVDIVVLESNGVSRACEVHAPVVIAVACGRPRCGTIKLVVRDSNSVACVIAKHNVLATNKRRGNMVNPNKIGVIEGNSIAAPDLLRVKVRDMNVLDNNILNTLCDIKALALDNPLASYADETLVRSYENGIQCSIVILDTDLGRVRLIVGTPVILIDGKLTGRSCTIGSTASGAGRAFSSSKVKGSVQDNNSGRRVAEIGHELGSCRGVNGSG